MNQRGVHLMKLGTYASFACNAVNVLPGPRFAL